MRREVGILVGLVLLVDGIFIGLYYVLGLATASAAARVGYGALWTALTLLVVLRALGRVRRIRVEGRRRS